MAARIKILTQENQQQRRSQSRDTIEVLQMSPLTLHCPLEPSSSPCPLVQTYRVQRFSLSAKERNQNHTHAPLHSPVLRKLRSQRALSCQTALPSPLKEATREAPKLLTLSQGSTVHLQDHLLLEQIKDLWQRNADCSHVPGKIHL